MFDFEAKMNLQDLVYHDNNNNNNHTCQLLELRRREMMAVARLVYAASAPNFRARIKFITSIGQVTAITRRATIRPTMWMNESLLLY